MASKKPALGKGLDLLLGDAGLFLDDRANGAKKTNDELLHIGLDFLSASRFQPRKDMDPEALKELSESIASQGVIQPIVVRALAEQGYYEIIAGERRFRAAKLAGLETIPAVVKCVDDQSATGMALVENIQREALNPIEQALSMKRLQDEFGLTHQVLAKLVGRSRVSITNLLRLLVLEETVKKMLTHGELEMGHARALLALEKNQQIMMAKHVVNKSMSVRQTEVLVRQVLDRKKEDAKASQKEILKRSIDTRKWASSIASVLAARVNIKTGAKESGKIVIEYDDKGHFDQIMGKLAVDFSALDK